MPNFLTALNQIFLQDIIKSFEELYLDSKSIEFHLPHYEVPQLSSHKTSLQCWPKEMLQVLFYEAKVLFSERRITI